MGLSEKLGNTLIPFKTRNKMSFLTAFALAQYGGLDKISKPEIGTAQLAVSYKSDLSHWQGLSDSG
jgi:hypothetical protein